MAKALFRYMRGELNGFYLQNIQNMMNLFTKDIKDFFYDFKKQQFAFGEISDETLNNLGKFAGIYLIRLTKAEALSSIRLSDTFVVGRTEYSERGLFNPETEHFDYTTGVNLPEGEDINSYATEESRSSLIGNEEPVGYIDYRELNVVDEDGKVRPDKVLPVAPEEGAYSEYYGDQFLFLSEGEASYTDMSAELLIDLFKAMQWVRYNGASITSLCKIISILCPKGLVTIDSITPDESGSRFYMRYTYHSESLVDIKQQRLYSLQYIIRLKFMQIELIESE